MTVTYRVGTKGAFKPALGTTSWSINAKFKPGKNVIAIRVTAEEMSFFIHIERGLHRFLDLRE